MKAEHQSKQRTCRVTIRFLDSEYAALYTEFQRSTHQEFSGFLRQCLLKKKITIYTRNQSFDLLVTELGQLRQELKGTETQAGKELLMAYKSLNGDAQTNLQKLIKTIQDILAKINQIADLWWHESTAPKALPRHSAITSKK